MKGRRYGQFCGLARALELVGERWALLIVHDLLTGPKRFTDLRRSLPRIPTNVLSARLKELERSGLARRRTLPRPTSATVYELTEYGDDLRDVVARLSRWGGRSLTWPTADETVPTCALIAVLDGAFQPASARRLRFSCEFQLGDAVVHAIVDDGTLATGAGPLPSADLVVRTGVALWPLLAGDLVPAVALADGTVTLVGRAELLTRVLSVFRIQAVLSGESAPRPDTTRVSS